MCHSISQTFQSSNDSIKEYLQWSNNKKRIFTIILVALAVLFVGGAIACAGWGAQLPKIFLTAKSQYAATGVLIGAAIIITLLALAIQCGKKSHQSSSPLLRFTPPASCEDPMKPSIACFPNELILHTAVFLDAKELEVCRQVCKEWSVLFNDEALWKIFCKRAFITIPSRNFKQFYIENDPYILSLTLIKQKKLAYHHLIEPEITDEFRCVQVVDRWLISGSVNGIIYVSDLKSGKQLRQWEGRISCLQAIDNLIVTGFKDGTIKIWDLASSVNEPHVVLGKQTWDGVRCLQISGNRIYAASEKGKVEAWDIGSWSCLGTLDLASGTYVKTAHENKLGRIDSLCVQGDYTVIHAGNSVFVQKKLGPFYELFKAASLQSASMHIRDNSLITIDDENQIYIWDLTTAALLRHFHLRELSEHEYIGSSHLISKYLVCAVNNRIVENGEVKIIDLESGKVIRSLLKTKKHIITHLNQTNDGSLVLTKALIKMSLGSIERIEVWGRKNILN